MLTRLLVSLAFSVSCLSAYQSVDIKGFVVWPLCCDDFMILACAVFAQQQRMADRQTS